MQFETEPTFIEVEIDAYIDAEIFSKAAGLSLEQLRSDNPALRPIVWEGRKRIPKGYKVKIREVFVHEDFLNPDNETIAVGFSNKDSSGLIEFTSNEFDVLFKSVKDRIHLIKGIKIFKDDK